MKAIGTALGFIETVGLVAAVTAADAALKAADVSLLGRENSKGSGMITVKIAGDVGAVRAALAAATAEATRLERLRASHLIARPAREIDAVMVRNVETMGVSTRLEIVEADEIPPEAEKATEDRPEEGTLEKEKDESAGPSEGEGEKKEEVLPGTTEAEADVLASEKGEKAEPEGKVSAEDSPAEPQKAVKAEKAPEPPKETGTARKRNPRRGGTKGPKGKS